MRKSPLRRAARPAAALVLLVAVVAAGGPPGGSSPSIQSAAADEIDWGDPVAPPGTPRIGDAPDGTSAPIFFAFQRDQAGLEQFAAGVTDPSSSSYGDYLPVEELAESFGVGQAHRQAYSDGILGLGAEPSVDVTGSFADPTLTVGQLEDLLGVTFGVYDQDGTDVIAPDALPTSTPAALAGVTIVRGLDIYPAPSSGPTPPPPPAPTPTGDYPSAGGTPYRTGTAHGCPEATALTNPVFDDRPKGLAPNQIREAYGIDELHDRGITGEGVRLALVEAGDFRLSDLAAFKECFGIEAAEPIVHGSQPEGSAGVEASLDIEVLSLVAPGAERFDVFQTPLDDSWQFAPFLSAPLDASQMDGALPHVVSVSYGECELFMTEGGDGAEVPVFEFVLATGAAAGVGYYAAAGDSGSSGCYHDDGTTTTESAGYPSTSNWATAVGGTNLTLGAGNSIEEQGVWDETAYFQPPQNSVSEAGGGGGASSLMQRPAWQHGPGVPAGSTRLNPDVALFADESPGWIIYCTIPDTGFCPTTGWATVGGTSAATPLMAGIAALATQATEEAGRVAMGFAAPLLYELARDPDVAAAVFYDVVVGSNDIFAVGCCEAGPGYDLASGWGSVYADGLVGALVPQPIEDDLVVPRFAG